MHWKNKHIIGSVWLPLIYFSIHSGAFFNGFKTLAACTQAIVLKAQHIGFEFFNALLLSFWRYSKLFLPPQPEGLLDHQSRHHGVPAGRHHHQVPTLLRHLRRQPHLPLPQHGGLHQRPDLLHLPHAAPLGHWHAGGP